MLFWELNAYTLCMRQIKFYTFGEMLAQMYWLESLTKFYTFPVGCISTYHRQIVTNKDVHW